MMGRLMTLAQTASWLTARRLRAHGLVLALGLWSVYLWNIARPGLIDRVGNLKGTDFLHFYTLGLIALGHRGGDLYNMPAQSALVAQRVPAAAGIRYLPLYPPQLSILFNPLARLPYPRALIVWLMFSGMIYGLACYAIWRASPHLRNCGRAVLVLALAFPAFWHLIAWGQTSALALACFTASFFAMRARREFLAGMALGCLAFKPQLALAAAIVFLFTVRWKMIAGGILSASAQFAAALSYYGTGALRDWWRAMVNLPASLSLLEPRLYQTHCLRTFWSMLVPWTFLSLTFYVASAGLVLAAAIACWRSPLPLSLRYSALLLATVLVAPHLTVYDLVILAPAFLLLSDWTIAAPENPATPTFRLLLYSAFALPLLGPLARWTHLQLSVPVMAALVYGIWSFGRKSEKVPNSL